jgi:hypothetical protein
MAPAANPTLNAKGKKQDIESEKIFTNFYLLASAHHEHIAFPGSLTTT